MGTAEDPVDGEGTASLLGRLLRDQANLELAELGAAVEVEVLRDEFFVELVAAPGAWETAFGALEEILYDAALPGARLAPAREEILEILTFESGAPVRAFELERSRILRGPGDPGARPPRGTLASVGRLELSDLESFRRRHLLEEQAVLAVTGPITAEDLEGVVAGPVRVVTPRDGSADTGADSLTGPANAASTAPAEEAAGAPRVQRSRDAPPLEVPTTPTGSPAWTVDDRTVIDQQLTSTWMAVAFPFPRGTPELLLDFVGHLVLESLMPSPPDPGLYGAEVSAQEIDGAPVLVVSAGVDPRITTRWEDRLASSLDSIATEPPRGSFFELARRRFRSDLLLELAVPENRARWLAREAAASGGTVSNPAADVWRIRRESVAAAAAAAGPPRTILYGPVQMMDR